MESERKMAVGTARKMAVTMAVVRAIRGVAAKATLKAVAIVEELGQMGVAAHI